MGWKDWPYWIRGGTISILPSLMVLFFSYNIYDMCTKVGERALKDNSLDICAIFHVYGFLPTISIIIILLIMGVMIGLIYGKTTKNKLKGRKK